ncbi:MAG TPA: hypothetical protein VMT29_07125 [Steroidobacteraceae bacterium]|nr:hypothetical protein [Steroidobacteraceae bacterium]
MQEGLAAQRRFLEECLTGDLLRLALQPIVSATDTCAGGYEALLLTVRRLGADLLQGYLFGRPADAPVIVTPSGIDDRGRLMCR